MQSTHLLVPKPFLSQVPFVVAILIFAGRYPKSYNVSDAQSQALPKLWFAIEERGLQRRKHTNVTSPIEVDC